MKNFKKFLIISSYAPPAISGAPLMMYNLLRYFPEDSFCILTSSFGIDKQADKNRWLRVKYFFFDHPFLTVTSHEEAPFSFRVKAFLREFPITNFLGQIFFLFYSPFQIVRLGKKIIDKEKIELLLGYSDHGPAILSTYILHLMTKRPFFLFFYDLYYGNRFPLLYKLLAYFLEPKIFHEAEKIFVMSEKLQDYYSKKYHREIILIRNSIPIEEKQLPKFFSHSGPYKTEPYKIVYTGTIYWAQIDAIKNLISAVKEIKQPKIQLWLYTPHDKIYLNRRGIFENNKIIFDKVSPSKAKAVQKNTDILFVGLTFNKKYSLLINTSSPGKTYEYLISGRPILIHAPKDSYLSQYAKKHNFALVIDEPDIEKLKRGILELIQNQDLAKNLVENAKKTAILYHDAKKNSFEFQRFFYLSRNF